MNRAFIRFKNQPTETIDYKWMEKGKITTKFYFYQWVGLFRCLMYKEYLNKDIEEIIEY